MSLLDMINEYQELQEERKGLEEATKRNLQAIEETKQKIGQQMMGDDIQEISSNGYTFRCNGKDVWIEGPEKEEK